ncbi:MAG: YbjN domain-containing protein [Ruminococcus sp.]|nr:YbjN domain-containing protein [Ruminococcus sp.]
MKSLYSEIIEKCFETFNISCKKKDENHEKNVYTLDIPSKYIGHNIVIFTIDTDNEVEFYGVIPLKFDSNKRTDILDIINTLNCENVFFTAYIDVDNSLVFNRNQILYGDMRSAVTKVIALIRYLEKYIDTYIEHIASILK